MVAPITLAEMNPGVAETDPVLNPFSVYAHGEGELARQLAILSPEQLRAIIVVYNLTHSVTDLETLTDQELIAWIVGAVRDQLAA